MNFLFLLAAKVKPVDVVIIVLAVVAVVGVCLLAYFRKKKGVSSCGCGCSSCSACPGCAAQKKKNTAQEKARDEGEEKTPRTDDNP